jgi:type VI secretion system protein ImpM
VRAVSAFSIPGLFGKIPARADFVRVRAASPAAREMVRWLEEGSEAAKRAGAPAGAGAVRFLFSPPGLAQVVVGVLKDSADQVGRRFPLAVFAVAEGRQLAAAFPLVPQGARTFLDAASALLDGSDRLAPQDLPARLEALPVIGEDALARVEPGLAALAAGARVSELMQRLFGELHSGQHCYALHCFRTACQPPRGRDPTGPGVVVDCPAQEDLDWFAWLELARRALAGGRAPTFFWSEGGPGRLLIALGAPPAAAFAALWNPAHRDGKLWPLTTQRSEAIAAAKKSLGPAVMQLLERPGASVAELLSTLYP